MIKWFTRTRESCLISLLLFRNDMKKIYLNGLFKEKSRKIRTEIIEKILKIEKIMENHIITNKLK